jgi:hypothetical protein
MISIALIITALLFRLIVLILAYFKNTVFFKVGHVKSSNVDDVF